MKLNEFDFNSISTRGLAIYENGTLIASGFIGDVLRRIPHLKDKEILDTNYYFDEFVIRL